MKISVVTPSYNQAPYLERTLASIHDQTGAFELEHIVIDGASTDGSVEILERWADRLTFVSEPDRGQSDALAKGFARATGDILAWLNSDDLYLPGALARVADFFQANPTVDWVYGGCIIVDENDREIRRGVTRYKDFLGRRYSYSLLLLEDFINQPATFFRRSLFERAGNSIDIDLHYVMDYDLWLRFGRIQAPGRIDENLAAFRFYRQAKTGGSFAKSLREANAVVRRHARAYGKPWIGTLNHWWYERRTVLAYRFMESLADFPRGKRN